MDNPISQEVIKNVSHILNNRDTRRLYYSVLKKIIDVNQSLLDALNDKFRELITNQHIRKDAIALACERIVEIQGIKNITQSFVQAFLSEIQTLQPNRASTDEKVSRELIISINNLDALYAELALWVAEQYAPLDERNYVTETPKVRRFDSLARVLSSQQESISVCSAVTIDTSSDDASHLIISSNLSGQEQSGVFISELAQKLFVLKEFYTSRHAIWHASLAPKAYYDMASQLFQKLFPHKTSSRNSMLFQAVYKTVCSLLNDDSIFSDREKQAFLIGSTSVALLPQILNGMLMMQISALNFSLNSAYSINQKIISLEKRIPNNYIKFIHAEQLLALYLFNVKKVPMTTAFIFGISKLCCATCSQFLENYTNVQIRGHHHKSFKGVYNLANVKQEESSSKRGGPIAANSSPFQSPFKFREEAYSSEDAKYASRLSSLFSGQEDSIRRRLSFDSLEKSSDAEFEKTQSGLST